MPKIFVIPCLGFGKLVIWLRYSNLSSACTVLSYTEDDKQNQSHFSEKNKSCVHQSNSASQYLPQLPESQIFFLVVSFIRFGRKIGAGSYLWNCTIFFMP